MAAVRVGSLGDRLADELRVQIIQGELASGTHLVEDSLAEKYDVSRGPVRDALKQLAAENLVVAQRRGFQVRGIDADDVAELYELRSALESLAVAKAATAETNLEPLAGAMAAMSRAADDGDYDAYARHDLDFHSAIFAVAANRRAEAMWGQLRPSFAVMLQMTNAQDVDLHPSGEDHRAILAAIDEGRASDAVALVQRHLDGSRERMMSAIST